MVGFSRQCPGDSGGDPSVSKISKNQNGAPSIDTMHSPIYLSNTRFNPTPKRERERNVIIVYEYTFHSFNIKSQNSMQHGGYF
jgi:hypothetical protein